jgi:hypothetical protein
VRLAAQTGLLLGTAGWTAVILGTVLPYLLALPFAAVTVSRTRFNGDRPAALSGIGEVGRFSAIRVASRRILMHGRQL